MSPPLLDLVPVFNAQPGATLLLLPDWVIVGASDDYLAATLTERATIVGQFIFDAFPDNPQTPEANAVANVRASLLQVLATKQPHTMAPQHYDVPDRTQPGRFVERYWQPCHTPVLDAGGQVQFIIQSVQDITASRLAERQLRESQASERAARAEAEQQRTGLQRIFQEAPVAMSLLRGPDFVVEWVNPRMGQLWGRPVAQVLGRPHFEALPDLAGQGFEQVFADVLTTGQPCVFQELLVRIEQDQQPYQGYFNITYRPVYEGPERITGILAFAVEVTEQVRARQQVQILNEELAALNEELLASNEEYQLANTALSETQQQLQQLNHELEARVQERTSQLTAAQAATERQRRQWHELFMRAPAAICIFDGPDWVYEFVNPGYQAMFPGRALLGKPLLEALPEVADQPLMAILHHVYDTGEPFEASEVLVPLARTQGGPVEDIYFDLTYLARYNEAGQIDGFVTYAYDMTEQVRARQRQEAYAAEVQESEARFRTLADAAPNMVWDLNPDGSVRYVNTYYLEFLGITLDAFVASSWTPYLLPEDVAPTEQLLSQAIAGHTLFSMEHRMRRHDGQYRWLLTQGGPSYFASGELYGYVGSAIDINDLKQANEQLRRANVDLDNFIYTASHDLKAPISNIEGLLLALEHELPAAGRVGDVPHMLMLMQQATERFKRTILHLTDVSRLQQAHNQVPEPVGLAAIIEAVRLDLLPLLAQTQGQVVVQVPADLLLTFSEKNLRSVVYNLLSNALKYHHPNRVPQVRLASYQQEAYTVLTVEDNGLGLDLAHGQDKLFALFQRLHTHVEGTGIGLYMVKRIMENAGGRIEVESQLGQGTTFRVYFVR
ncbi:MAG: PAS domain S-box protein [Hymenobacter sp.]|nr:MAG: PAS domain S-box protein [Hymenobacter sp.]